MLKRFVNPMLAGAAVLSIVPGAAFAQSQAVTNAGGRLCRPWRRLSGGDATARRRRGHRDGLRRRLYMVRRGSAGPAWLGLWRQPELSVSGRQCSSDELRDRNRVSDRHLCHRKLLGQLLPQPAVVPR